jgi:hypothetical protein
MDWQVTVEDAAGALEVLDQTHGTLDEVIVGDWLHFEHMSKRHWFLRLGESAYNVVIAGERLAASTPPMPDAFDLEPAAAPRARKQDTWSVLGTAPDGSLDREGRGRLVSFSCGRWLDLRAAEPGRFCVRIVRESP